MGYVIYSFLFIQYHPPIKGAGGVPGTRPSKLSVYARCMLGDKSYLLVFTASKNTVPSQSYGLFFNLKLFK